LPRPLQSCSKGRENLMKYKFKSLIILSVPNRNPIPGKDISILFMCKSSLNIS
jgi:hypothetical protein